MILFIVYRESKTDLLIKDTLKVSGTQVSPMEIENCLLAHPKKLINDVSVAGVLGGRTEDERVPRAWIVLSDSGKRLGNQVVIEELNTWHKNQLSKYKWLRGGIEIIDEVNILSLLDRTSMLTVSIYEIFARYLNLLLGKPCAEFFASGSRIPATGK